KRVSSVKSTQQITRAMKMVSAAKLRRAQDGINAARPYARKMREVIQAVAAKAGEDAHPLLASREGTRLALLVVTSDRGLCGSFNSGLTRAVHRFLKEHRDEYEEVTLFVIGRKGRDFFRRREIPIRKEYLGVLGSVSRNHAEAVANDLVGGFLDGEFDEVQIAFNEFRSAISQVVRFEKMFPIALESSGEAARDEVDYLYEPSREEILAKLLPKYVQTMILRVLLESVAGEHGARMTAMDSATNNSVDMIARLTLQMNRARQATITTELTEIVSGAEALKG
ncbi:MAG: ATP synthase F1 subunit gamma, partial [Desulfobacteria bacterium]